MHYNASKNTGVYNDLLNYEFPGGHTGRCLEGQVRAVPGNISIFGFFVHAEKTLYESVATATIAGIVSFSIVSNTCMYASSLKLIKSPIEFWHDNIPS